MLEIGPNLLSLGIALVGLGASVIAFYRAEKAIGEHAALQTRVDANSARVGSLEAKVNDVRNGGTPRGSV